MTMPRVIRWSHGGRFLMSELTQYVHGSCVLHSRLQSRSPGCTRAERRVHCSRVAAFLLRLRSVGF